MPAPAQRIYVKAKRSYRANVRGRAPMFLGQRSASAAEDSQIAPRKHGGNCLQFIRGMPEHVAVAQEEISLGQIENDATAIYFSREKSPLRFQ